MGQERTLARGARIFGALLLAALALLSLGWIIRDFTKASEVTDVWWNWSNAPARAENGDMWTTAFTEPTLMLMYAVAAVTAARSSAAAGILTSAGVLTVLLRLPGLWNLNADWMQGIPDGLKSKVLFSTIAMVVVGVVLVITAVAGRRPAEPAGGHGYGFPPAYDPAEEPPACPTRGGGVAAFLLLAASAVAIGGWEIYWWQDRGWEFYERTLTGERSIVALLAVPNGWHAWTVALLALVAGVAALSGAPFSRPMGLLVSAPLAATGLFSTSYAVKMKLIENFDDLSTREQLSIATGVFELVAGLAVLLALAPRGERDAHLVPHFQDSAASPYGPPVNPPGGRNW